MSKTSIQSYTQAMQTVCSASQGIASLQTLIISIGMVDVPDVVRTEKPDVLFTASMWTPEESTEIHQTAKDIVGPHLKTFALPQGLQVERGPDAVVDYIKENLPGLLESQ